MALGNIFAGLGFIGVIVEFFYAIALIAQRSKLSPDDFGLRVFLPMIISLILIGVGTCMILVKDPVLKGINESFYMYMIPIIAVGGIYLSYTAIILSNLVVRWKAD